MTLASFVHDHARDIGRWWQAQRAIGNDISMLRTMSADEIDELTGELGLSRAQLEALVRAGPNAADETERMMAALGIDPAALAAAHPDNLREIRLTWSTCGNKSTCRHALAEATAAALLKSFCPNADELLSLAAEPALRSA